MGFHYSWDHSIFQACEASKVFVHTNGLPWVLEMNVFINFNCKNLKQNKETKTPKTSNSFEGPSEPTGARNIDSMSFCYRRAIHVYASMVRQSDEGEKRRIIL